MAGKAFRLLCASDWQPQSTGLTFEVAFRGDAAALPRQTKAHVNADSSDSLSMP